jgi:hypothetical protein
MGTVVGTYEVQPGVDISDQRDGDYLTTQLTGQPEFPIFAASEAKFFLKVVNAGCLSPAQSDPSTLRCRAQ